MKLKRQFEKVVLESKGRKFVLACIELKKDVRQNNSVVHLFANRNNGLSAQYQ